MKYKNFITYLKAMSLMIGYIIGVGMFGLPLLVAKAGIISFIVIFISIFCIQYFIHLIYADVILETKSKHRMPGYAEKYLGKPWKEITFLAKIIGNYGGLLAYIIITGIFLNQLLNPIFGGSEFIYSNIIFFVEATIVLFGIGMIASAELILMFVLLVVIALLSIKGIHFIEIENFKMIEWKYLLLPYGAMLFALDGNGSLPIVARIVNRDKKMMKKVVTSATVLAALIILVFTLVIVGISGASTTQDALSGISKIMGPGVVTIALIFGIISMVTSFIGVAEAIKETFWWDFKVNKLLAWALAVFVPYFMFLFGFKNLIGIISFAGAVAGGMSAIILIMVFKKLGDQKMGLALFKKKPNIIILSFLVSLFVLGVVYEIWAFSTL
jgi:tyrosine-specific transport protein